MKLLSNKIKIEIQDDLKLLWEIKGCIFTYSPIDFNYNLIQLEDGNFFIIDKFNVYFFDNQIYITDEIKLIYLSHNGNIIWIYWHFDSIDFIDFVEKNNYLSLHSSNEITEIDRNTGGILKSKP